MPSAADNTDIEYLESKFQYAFLKHGEKDLRKLQDDEQEKLIQHLEGFKKCTWREMVNMDRKKGLTPERREKSNASFNKTVGRFAAEHNGNSLYPFHMRASSISSKFRVFGYQYQNTFFITQLDSDHKQHRRS